MSEPPRFWRNNPYGKDPAVPERFPTRPPDLILKTNTNPPPLGRNERGLIMSYPHRPHLSDPTQISIDMKIDMHDLRFALLFWDKLNIPFLHDIERSGEEQFLIDAEVLQNTTFEEPEGLYDQGIALKVGLAAFRELSERDDGRWSMGHISGDHSLGRSAERPGEGLIFRLHQAIPVPDKDVPLAEILDFRAKRRDELLALRERLEEVYLAISDHHDRPLSEVHAMEKLEREILNYMNVAREASFKKVLGTLVQNLKVNVLPIGGVLAGMAISQRPLTLLSSVGIVGGAVSLSVGPSLLGLGKRKTNQPFEYAKLIHREMLVI